MRAMLKKLRQIQVKLLFADKDALFDMEGTSTGHRFRDCDSEKLRREFMELRTDEQFTRFFGERGDFDQGPLPESMKVAIAQMHEWQRLLRVLSRTPRGQWGDALWHGGRPLDSQLRAKYGFSHTMFERAVTHRMSIIPGSKDGAPAEIISHTTLDAMLDVLHVEKMEGYEIRCCKLKGCLGTFQKKDNYAKKYCCPEHANLASVRRFRGRHPKRKAAVSRTAVR
jgi:hypothetical protein